ncbi:hypothetical protein K227x_31220 [Rubripirellula lacrimiformis]|uniref:Uncharacterized protein n=1 Tax=Rubripirellula lacrimiformis TaxID=1930273 RepID=A0A517NC69_9BACT|nr:hypothetical protein K227x_31220 [Rubripirellula lacrimiformis]
MMAMMPRRQFSLAALLLVTAVTAILFAAGSRHARRRAATIATYDAQKIATDQAIESFAETLISEGWAVTNSSVRQGGSGEWRTRAMLSCTQPGQPSVLCNASVMGFVSHDDADRPDWLHILPMRLSSHRGKLDDRFIAVLVSTLEKHQWQYTVQSSE